MVHPFSDIGILSCDALESRGVGGKRRFLDTLLPPMDRFGTGKEKHYPNWLLGVQSSGKPVSAELLPFLSERFGRGNYDVDAPPSLYQKLVPEMAGGSDRQAG